MRKYTQIVNDIKQSVVDLESRGITVKPLNDAISELLLHTENLGKIEDNLESIRQEVISPIKRELNENRKSGKFSIFGFYVGAIGLLISIIAIFYTTPFFSELSDNIFNSDNKHRILLDEYIPIKKYKLVYNEKEKLKKINIHLNRGMIDVSGIEEASTDFIYECKDKIKEINKIKSNMIHEARRNRKESFKDSTVSEIRNLNKDIFINESLIARMNDYLIEIKAKNKLPRGKRSR